MTAAACCYSCQEIAQAPAGFGKESSRLMIYTACSVKRVNSVKPAAADFSHVVAEDGWSARASLHQQQRLAVR